MVFLKALSKLTLIGGAGGAAYLSNIVDISNELISKPTKPKETDIPSKIKRLEHIDIYEKYYSCSFVFVKSLGSKEAYKWKKFLVHQKEDRETGWQDLVIKGAEKFKEKCRSGQIISLSYKRQSEEFMITTK